jgi:hypothetical protein
VAEEVEGVKAVKGVKGVKSAGLVRVAMIGIEIGMEVGTGTVTMMAAWLP